MKINQTKITKKLSDLDLSVGSKQTKFIKRKGGKVTAEAYLLGFFMMVLQGSSTLFNWSLQICKLIDGITLSEQGLEKKLSFRQVAFAKWLLAKSLQVQLVGQLDKTSCSLLKQESKCLERFNRVLLQDSTCINVPSNLADFFPSSFVKQGKSATARIQLISDLLSDNYEHITLGSFRDNDGKASKDILEVAKSNDLILRDKGYWSLDVFTALDKKGCYFLSRLKFGVNLYEQDNQNSKETLNLGKILNQAKKDNRSHIDITILLGAKHRLKVRLVAIRLPQEVADERRRKAKVDRHSKANHSKEYYDRLDWCIFITNVPEETLDAFQVAKVYRFRWRIEIIFKVWKSKFDFDKMFDKKSMKPSRAIITFYLLLAWLTLFFARLYNFFLIKVYQKINRFVSIFKFAEFLKIFIQDENQMDKLINNPQEFIDLVASSCLYDKRKRQNQWELILS